MRIGISLFIVALLGTFAWALLGCGDNTQEAPGFSEAAFSKVEVGMSKDQVLEMLGPPIAEECNNLPEYWQYGTKDQIWNSATPKGVKFIVFDDRGLATHVGGDASISIPLGSGKGDVLRLLGEPRIRMPKRPCTMNYTWPKTPGNDCMRVRQISFDDHQRVADILTYSMLD